MKENIHILVAYQENCGKFFIGTFTYVCDIYPSDKSYFIVGLTYADFGA